MSTINLKMAEIEYKKGLSLFAVRLLNKIREGLDSEHSEDFISNVQEEVQIAQILEGLTFDYGAIAMPQVNFNKKRSELLPDILKFLQEKMVISLIEPSEELKLYVVKYPGEGAYKFAQRVTLYYEKIQELNNDVAKAAAIIFKDLYKYDGLMKTTFLTHIKGFQQLWGIDHYRPMQILEELELKQQVQIVQAPLSKTKLVYVRKTQESASEFIARMHFQKQHDHSQDFNHTVPKIIQTTTSLDPIVLAAEAKVKDAKADLARARKDLRNAKAKIRRNLNKEFENKLKPS